MTHEEISVPNMQARTKHITRCDACGVEADDPVDVYINPEVALSREGQRRKEEYEDPATKPMPYSGVMHTRDWWTIEVVETYHMCRDCLGLTFDWQGDTEGSK